MFIADAPPGPGTLIIFLLCLAASVMLFVAPFVKEFDARVRIAEAQASENIESQVRRLTQATAQLGNAVSRIQSGDEQFAQTIGALEEQAEKFNAQAEELAQHLVRSHEREIATLKADLERLRAERDDRLAALEQRLDVANGQASELGLNARKTAVTTGKTMDEMKERLIALASRLDDLGRTSRVSTATPVAVRAKVSAPAPAVTLPLAEESTNGETLPATTGPAVTTQSSAVEAKAEPESASRVEPEPEVATVAVAEMEALDTKPAAPAEKKATKPRVRRPVETASTSNPPSRISARSQPLDLPFLDLPEAAPRVHRDASGGTSTLVATAYIGIGNKLYVRGDGPGLSWEQGVPMQFLAIGKWGWTSPDAGAPITCRIYRNDETPMLDENITIPPGERAEITPRF